LFGQSQQGSASSIDAGHADGQDRDGNGGIDDMGKNWNACRGEDDDERTGICVVTSSDQSLIIVRYEETDENKGENKDKGDSPEGHFDGRWEGLSRIGVFGSGQSDKFGTGETECSSDKDSADSLEPVCECTWIVKVSSSVVLAICTIARSASENEYKRCEKEDENDCQLEAG
jgi:hypothetical protein